MLDHCPCCKYITHHFHHASRSITFVRCGPSRERRPGTVVYAVPLICPCPRMYGRMVHWYAKVAVKAIGGPRRAGTFPLTRVNFLYSPVTHPEPSVTFLDPSSDVVRVHT